MHETALAAREPHTCKQDKTPLPLMWGATAGGAVVAFRRARDNARGACVPHGQDKTLLLSMWGATAGRAVAASEVFAGLDLDARVREHDDNETAASALMQRRHIIHE